VNLPFPAPVFFDDGWKSASFEIGIEHRTKDSATGASAGPDSSSGRIENLVERLTALANGLLDLRARN
jgi:hypothetical protein